MRNKVAKHLKKLTSIQEVKAYVTPVRSNVDKAMKHIWNGLTRAERRRRMERAGLHR